MMKKLTIFFTLLTVVAPLFLTSCSENEEINPLLGTWELIEVYEDLGQTYTAQVTFNSDNTGSIYSETVFHDTGETPNETADITYYANGNRLSITLNCEETLYSYTISENILTLTYDDSEIEDPVVFTKI